MHLHTTKKYGAAGFITRDGSLLAKATILEHDFGIAVFSPERALAFVERLKRRFDVRQQGSPPPGADGQRADTDASRPGGIE